MASRTAPQIVRSLVLNALDLFAEQVKPAAEASERSPLQRLAKQWKDLDDADREAVVEKMGVVAETIAAAIPLAVAATRARAARKRSRSEDEDDGETTKKSHRKSRKGGSGR